MDMTRESVIESMRKRESLIGADLKNIDLRGIDMVCAHLMHSDFSGSDLSGASLRGANLDNATIKDTILCGTDLTFASFVGIKEYYNSIDFMFECIRRIDTRVKTVTFNESDWAMIGILATRYPTWRQIKNTWGDRIMPLFKKLADNEFGEYEKHYDKVLKGE